MLATRISDIHPEDITISRIFTTDLNSRISKFFDTLHSHIFSIFVYKGDSMVLFAMRVAVLVLAASGYAPIPFFVIFILQNINITMFSGANI